MENIFKKEFWESKTGKDLKIPFFYWPLCRIIILEFLFAALYFLNSKNGNLTLPEVVFSTLILSLSANILTFASYIIPLLVRFVFYKKPVNNRHAIIFTAIYFVLIYFVSSIDGEPSRIHTADYVLVFCIYKILTAGAEQK